MNAVAFHDVSVRLGGHEILSRVSLEIAAGEFVGVLGPNGAGKTTLMRSMLGLIPVSRGVIRVLGGAAARGNPAIGYMPQVRGTSGHLRLSGWDFVASAVDGCCSEANNFLREGVRNTPGCYANFREILEQFGLDERSIVANVKFFMSVPVLPDDSAGVSPQGTWSSCALSATCWRCCRTARRCATRATGTIRRRPARRSIARGTRSRRKE